VRVVYEEEAKMFGVVRPVRVSGVAYDRGETTHDGKDIYDD